jgi:ribosomal protein S14
MQAYQCDRCGTLHAGNGSYSVGFTHKHKGEFVRDLRAILVEVLMKPVNQGDNPYQGIDLCRDCIRTIAAEALRTIAGGDRQAEREP